MSEAVSKDNKNQKTVTTIRLRLIMLGVFLGLFALFAGLAMSGVLQGVEDAFYRGVARTINNPTTSIMRFITYMAESTMIVMMLLLLVIIPQTRKKFGYPLTVTAIISVSLNEGLKAAFGRERPQINQIITASRLSFPSGHAQGAAAFYIAAAIILFFMMKKHKALIAAFVACIVLTILIGYSRIYLGVHYLGDVLAGWALGISVAILVNIVFKVLELKTKHKKRCHKFLFDQKPKILLASGSPRRRELLKTIATDFSTCSPNIDEIQIEGENAVEYVTRMAREKSKRGSEESPDAISIGVDTIVVFNNKILQKPKDKAEAIEFLQMLSNNSHTVYTAMAIINKETSISTIDKATVTFSEIPQEKIALYVETLSPLDKAGGYGVQDELIKPFIKEIDGSPKAVIGLNTLKLKEILEKWI